jgi:glutamine synthetase
MSAQTPKDVIDYIRDHDIRMVDIRFIDMLGAWQHFSVPAHELTEDAFEEGFGFDGSSVRGWKTINASDMLVMPEASTAKIDPFMAIPTLVLLGNAADTITRSDYERCPRSLAGRADSDLGFWNTNREEFPSLGYKIRHKGGYVPVPPADAHQDLRTEMVLALEELGIPVERQHMEVASGGQAEIDIRFDSLLAQADKLCWFKYVIKNVARRNGKTATFMPKPIFGDNGNGMHVHMSLWKAGQPLFAGEQYAGLSELALHFIAGILQHAPSLCAFTNPGTNSYKRLVPGFEAPVNLAYSSRNRSASIRIPTYTSSPKAIRIEFRTPDPSANPYLAFSAMMLAGLDGIQKRLDPGEPLDKDIYSLSPEELADVPSAPGSLDEALEALEDDHEYLLAGDVFSRDLLEAWIEWKRANEVTEVRRRPHPHEFGLYFDC